MSKPGEKRIVYVEQSQESCFVLFGPPISSDQTEDRLIEVPQAVEMIKKGAAFVDVRTREQIQSQTNGQIPADATVIPFDDWVGGIPPVFRGKKIILTCWKGNKSTLAWESLRSQFADAYVLKGGFNAWEADGLPIKTI